MENSHIIINIDNIKNYCQLQAIASFKRIFILLITIYRYITVAGELPYPLLLIYINTILHAVYHIRRQFLLILTSAITIFYPYVIISTKNYQSITCLCGFFFIDRKLCPYLFQNVKSLSFFHGSLLSKGSKF